MLGMVVVLGAAH